MTVSHLIRELGEKKKKGRIPYSVRGGGSSLETGGGEGIAAHCARKEKERRGGSIIGEGDGNLNRQDL